MSVVLVYLSYTEPIFIVQAICFVDSFGNVSILGQEGNQVIGRYDTV